MNVEKILEAVEEKNLSIKDVDIVELIPNVIDDVIIIVLPDKTCMLDIPNSMTGDKVKKWKKSRGGVFFKDVKQFIKDEAHGNYVVLEGDGRKIVARLIEEDELEIFSHLNIIDGKIKDKAYMIVRNVTGEEKLSKNNRYIEQTDNMDLDPKIVVINPDISSELDGDSENQQKGSVSLFD